MSKVKIVSQRFCDNPAVVVNSVSKRFKVTGSSSSAPTSIFRRDRTSVVNALRDVSFVAEKGESVGVIGRNGSGKSTLLRIIAGGEAPSSGEVFVSSQPTLLGVAPALQQWLTGEQNIYLGCLALGMNPLEAGESVKDIAEWSEIGEALHRPMNTYSSGMAARLSFAISTSVRPDILLVDETLSTGDAAFGAKAQERMARLLERAATLFLVTHSSSTIRESCERAIWIDRGSVVADGDAESVSALYEEFSQLAQKSVSEAAVMVESVRATYTSPTIHLTGTVGSAVEGFYV